MCLSPGIPPHVDTPSAFEDGIMSLSCGSQVNSFFFFSSSSSFLVYVCLLAHLCPVFLSLFPLLTHGHSLYFTCQLNCFYLLILCWYILHFVTGMSKSSTFSWGSIFSKAFLSLGCFDWIVLADSGLKLGGERVGVGCDGEVCVGSLRNLPLLMTGDHGFSTPWWASSLCAGASSQFVGHDRGVQVCLVPWHHSTQVGHRSLSCWGSHSGGKRGQDILHLQKAVSHCR